MRNFKEDLQRVMEETGLKTITKFPFNENETLRTTGIDVLELTTRSSNGLLRKSVATIGGIIDNWNEISKWRGLGASSIKEIKSHFYEYYYSTLSDNEIEKFWITFVTENIN